MSLTDTQVTCNAIRFLDLFSDIGIDLTNINEYLMAINFFEYIDGIGHRAYKGGLCERTLCRYSQLVELASKYCPEQYSDETLVKVGLLRNLPTLKEDISKEEFNNIIKNFGINLTSEELEAIYDNHDGESFRRNKLCVLIEMADLAATFLKQ